MGHTMSHESKVLIEGIEQHIAGADRQHRICFANRLENVQSNRSTLPLTMS